MGVLDDAIREHLELKRRHGASETEVNEEQEAALGPARVLEQDEPLVEEPPEMVSAEALVDQAPVEDAPIEEPAAEEPAVADALDGDAIDGGLVPAPAVDPAEVDAEPSAVEEDVLEETPDFLQDTPEHDRLWFEQKPPRSFDFDE